MTDTVQPVHPVRGELPLHRHYQAHQPADDPGPVTTRLPPVPAGPETTTGNHTGDLTARPAEERDGDSPNHDEPATAESHREAHLDTAQPPSTENPTSDTTNDPADTAEEPVPGVERALPWVLLVGGLVGAASAIMLTIEKIRTLSNPDYVPSCNFNPLIACGDVMNTPQGEAFGFANPIIGIFAFAVVITVGVVLLCGATFPDWFWVGLAGGTVFGVGFIHWLFVESVWVIGKLCPYCMAVWIVTIAIFCYTLLAIASDPHFGLPGWLRRPARAVARVHALLPIVWVLVIAGLIIAHFWTVWPTVF